MEYKVLVTIVVPEIEEKYEVYLPINKTIQEVTVLLSEMVNDLFSAYPVKPNVHLCNRYTGVVYGPDQLIRETDIRNGTGLVFF